MQLVSSHGISIKNKFLMICSIGLKNSSKNSHFQLGGLLGVIIFQIWNSLFFLKVLFSIPLRRALIVERKLDFPEGKATAEVLKVGENSNRFSFLYILLGGFIGFIYKFCETGFQFWSYQIEYATYVGSAIFYFSMITSPSLFGS